MSISCIAVVGDTSRVFSQTDKSGGYLFGQDNVPSVRHTNKSGGDFFGQDNFPSESYNHVYFLNQTNKSGGDFFGQNSVPLGSYDHVYVLTALIDTK
jgi:hypothetical protein